ncbi:uncharacterized protein LAESUDRAFT_718707, partial [Laetiporus sulphureus 93-53]
TSLDRTSQDGRDNINVPLQHVNSEQASGEDSQTLQETLLHGQDLRYAQAALIYKRNDGTQQQEGLRDNVAMASSRFPDWNRLRPKYMGVVVQDEHRSLREPDNTLSHVPFRQINQELANPKLDSPQLLVDAVPGSPWSGFSFHQMADEELLNSMEITESADDALRHGLPACMLDMVALQQSTTSHHAIAVAGNPLNSSNGRDILRDSGYRKLDRAWQQRNLDDWGSVSHPWEDTPWTSSAVRLSLSNALNPTEFVCPATSGGDPLLMEMDQWDTGPNMLSSGVNEWEEGQMGSAVECFPIDEMEASTDCGLKGPSLPTAEDRHSRSPWSGFF